jgi:four helix bundle protein
VDARTIEELAVWKLANEVGIRVHAITANRPACLDRRFCDQLRDAASSVNVAEGFGRYRHREFANFLNIARGSFFEIRDHLKDGAARRYWTDASVGHIDALCEESIAAITTFIRYLRTHDDI